MAILEVENVSKVYGSGEVAVRALDDVSLAVEKGEFVAIVGSSGSGKSTLLHILGGVDGPSNGRVLVDSVDLSTLDESALAIFRRRQVGLIYQFYNLIPVLTVEENILLPLLLDGRKSESRQLDTILRMLNLEDRRRHLPSQLSGGQQQRVSIGRALINSPAIVLADEPTGNLDTHSSAEILSLLRRSNKEFGQTLIVITHDMDIALQADRVIGIEDGRIARDEGVTRK